MNTYVRIEMSIKKSCQLKSSVLSGLKYKPSEEEFGSLSVFFFVL